MAMDAAQTAHKITFVLGGSRSGKSRVALDLARSHSNVVFWATGLAMDAEMQERIATHRQSRPADWMLVEEPLDLIAGVARVAEHSAQCVVLDSVTTWAGNVLHRGLPTGKALEELRTLLKRVDALPGHWIIVSDEVGMSLVPESPMGRKFRDFLGDANQIIAAAAQRVICVIAGIPVLIQ